MELTTKFKTKEEIIDSSKMIEEFGRFSNKFKNCLSTIVIPNEDKEVKDYTMEDYANLYKLNKHIMPDAMVCPSGKKLLNIGAINDTIKKSNAKEKARRTLEQRKAQQLKK